MSRYISTSTVAAMAISTLAYGASMANAQDITGSTVAFLMPDQGSTRYEQHDHPGFVAEMKKLCESCKLLYQNADGDAAKQQQQFNSVIAQGAKVVVLDPVEFFRRRIASAQCSGPGRESHRLRSPDSERQS